MMMMPTPMVTTQAAANRRGPNGSFIIQVPITAAMIQNVFWRLRAKSTA